MFQRKKESFIKKRQKSINCNLIFLFTYLKLSAISLSLETQQKKNKIKIKKERKTQTRRKIFIDMFHSDFWNGRTQVSLNTFMYLTGVLFTASRWYHNYLTISAPLKKKSLFPTISNRNCFYLSLSLSPPFSPFSQE